MATHFSAVGQIRQFAGEAAADIRELRRFLKKEKALKLICLSLIVVCWGLKIVYDDIFIDSEIMSLEPYALLQSWYGSRRFSLNLYEKNISYDSAGSLFIQSADSCFSFSGCTFVCILPADMDPSPEKETI